MKKTLKNLADKDYKEIANLVKEQLKHQSVEQKLKC